MARSKEFDETEVLEKAMDLFWKKGYEKTSMQDLVTHMGIHRRSIYDTFGDKHSLFLACLNHYEKLSTQQFASIIHQAPTAKEAIQNIFEYVLEDNEVENPSAGCFTVNAAVELSYLDKEIQNITTKMFQDTEGLFSQLLEKGIKNGEFNSDLNIQTTAQYLHNNFIGLRVLVKMNYTKQELQNIILFIMKAI